MIANIEIGDILEYAHHIGYPVQLLYVQSITVRHIKGIIINDACKTIQRDGAWLTEIINNSIRLGRMIHHKRKKEINT